jgi:hypothetical protein
VLERSFAKDRRAIDMPIDSAVMVCGGTHDQITDFIEYGDGPSNLPVTTQAGFLSYADTVDSPVGEGDHAAAQGVQPKTAQNAAGVGDLARAVRVQIRLEF